MIRSAKALVAAVAAAAVALLLGAAPGIAAETDPGLRYVALGDSYTAAPFVPSVLLANGCVRSTNNYPHVVARTLDLTAFVDVSCSGAQTKDMFVSQLPGVGPQLDAVTPDTDVVTLGIGGNDFGVFGTLVGFCTTLYPSDPTGAPCRDVMRADGRDRLLADVAQIRERVRAVIAAVKQRAPQAQVIVVGYPQFAPRHGSCPDLLPLARGDLRYANQVNQRLTLALRRAAAQQHVDYVDVWRASRGHDVCSADPWINGRVTDYTRAQAYHPFANEQAAVAALVVQQID